MKREDLFNELKANGLMSSEQTKKAKQLQNPPVLSLFWEIKVLITIGGTAVISALSKILHDHFFKGLHTILIALMSVVMFLCFRYCFKYIKQFNRFKVKDVKPPFFDIILLGATTLFLGIEQYLVSLNIIFNEEQNLALLPTIVFLFSAYFFDDRAVLFKGLVGFVALFSISYKELKISFLEADFNVLEIFNKAVPVKTSIILGLIIITIAYASSYSNIKAHFKSRYLSFSLHLIMIAICTAIFDELNFNINALLLIFFGILYHIIGRKEKLNLLILFSSFYTYIGMTYYIFEQLELKGTKMVSIYIIITTLGFLVYFFRFIKRHGV